MRRGPQSGAQRVWRRGMWGFECLSLWRPSPHAMQTLLAGTPRFAALKTSLAFGTCKIWIFSQLDASCVHSGAFNHPHAAATEHAPPLPLGSVTDGWVLDHNRVQVPKCHWMHAVLPLQTWMLLPLALRLLAHLQ